MIFIITIKRITMKSDNTSTFVTGQEEPGQSYCLKLGKETIHGLSHDDLESLHKAIDEYFNREKEVFPARIYLSSSLGQFSEVQKMNIFNEGKFNVNYSVSAFGETIQNISALQLLDLFLSIYSFLRQVEKINIKCSIPKVKPRKIKSAPVGKNNHKVLLLEENDKQKEIEIIKDIPMIVKSETLTEVNVAPKIEYNVQINDQGLDGLSYSQVMEIQSVIKHFLDREF